MRFRTRRLPALVLLCFGSVCNTGCVSTSGQAQWGEQTRWPGLSDLGEAAQASLKAPEVWVPLLTAGALIAADVDNQWTEDLAEDQPLFGRDADKTSDTLRDVATGAYLLTALAAPSPSFEAKAKGLAVGLSTAVVDGVVTEGLKRAVGRERPNGRNDLSFPSGHASQAASRATMARYNLRHFELPSWANQSANVALHGVAIATGLARVEANKHHLSDVFVGYALGNYIAHFMQQAFLEGHDDGSAISFAPVENGGALTLTIPLH